MLTLRYFRSKLIGKFLRENRPDTQAIVADKLGVKPQHLNAWENGRAPVPRKHIAALSRIYGVPPEALVDQILESEKRYILSTIMEKQA